MDGKVVVVVVGVRVRRSTRRKSEFSNKSCFLRHTGLYVWNSGTAHSNQEEAWTLAKTSLVASGGRVPSSVILVDKTRAPPQTTHNGQAQRTHEQ